MPSQIQPQQLKWSTGNLTATTNVSTLPVQMWGGKNSFQVNLTGTGTVSVTATLQISNDGATWISTPSVSLSGTNAATNGVTLDAAWVYARITLTSITGTNATATAFHGGGGA
jgi:hypothetical protein